MIPLETQRGCSNHRVHRSHGGGPLCTQLAEFRGLQLRTPYFVPPMLVDGTPFISIAQIAAGRMYIEARNFPFIS